VNIEKMRTTCTATGPITQKKSHDEKMMLKKFSI